MDTNMSQALKLAGGLLIAIVLISALVYFFRALVPTQIALEDIKQFEQTIDFNKEFEVYNKDIMYGLDVISAINKAASYNKTYIDAYGYTDELKYNYLVDIELTEDIDLVQSIELYRIDRGTAREIPIDCEDITDDDDIDLICAGLEIDRDEGEFVDLREQELPRGNLIDKDRINDNLRNGKYVRSEIYTMIIEPSSQKLKRTIINPTNSPTYNPDVWSKAILETYVYNFKSKKFRCVGTVYSDITQRITKLVFEEI